MKQLSLSFLLTFFAVLVLFSAQAAPSRHQLRSPDGRLSLEVSVADEVSYTLQIDSKTVLAPSTLQLHLADGWLPGAQPALRRVRERQVDQMLNPLYGKRSHVRDQFNELSLEFRGNYSLIFRLYDEGLAWRWVTRLKGELTVTDESAFFGFASGCTVIAAHSSSGTFEHSYEELYKTRPLAVMPDSLAYLPVLVRTPEGISAVITETGLEDYPGFHLRKPAGRSGLEAAFPKYPTKAEPGGHMKFNLIVKERADYIARTAGTREFPWRVVRVASKDAELLDSELVYLLSNPQAEGTDFSWVKPGKVAWDWWCALNLTGVDFRTGINTDTYKYFIDFAARNGFEYINLDEGWSDQYDLMKRTDAIDLEEIVRYAKSKGVGVILWCVHYPLDQKLEEVMDMCQELGIAGLKVDFMDRDDQWMVNYYHRIADAAARHKLLVNFHGAYKPAGLHRKYPNVINREAVRGLEYNKFSRPWGTTPGYACTIPFVRMVAGPMDYTPGAMRNEQWANFGVFNERPMSQGTRCQQLAMYVLYEAPLQMITDAPTAYEAEPDILKFLSEVPTIWDETVALDGKVGEFAALARRKGDHWYVAAICDWTARDITLDLSFLGNGRFRAEILQDGVNADRVGSDYRKTTADVTRDSRPVYHLAPGGGVVLKISPKL
jgi:alpha-glucosidase